jgi:RNA polymerase sigma-70 factor (ECF subfamily)
MTIPDDPISPQAEFVGLLTECQLSLLLYIRSLMPGDHRAADVAQQANAKIWELRDDFELGTNFRAWAFAIARFEVLNHRKRQARDARLVFSEDLEKTIASELEEFSDNFLFRHEALRHCLNTLKPESRRLLMERYTSKDSLTDFANRIGRPAGSVKVSLHRLRTAIGECIERRLLLMENSK